MQCYFHGKVFDQSDILRRGKGIVSFSIPDVGIVFKAKFKGSAKECEYASLLALLEFIELNPHLFKNRSLEIYGDSFVVVHQVNMKMGCNQDLEPFRNLALNYKKKIHYTLNWIPRGDNPAEHYLSE
jgi:hypothetical protein